ncbi:hypothetical protein E1A91_D08G171100v1 [Gossypium mustelinum]|uniref:Tetraspanin n=1 Tax=Gossypium mustelinum TaxID=34275 RepID=A0A5D2TWS8_GOSMU|nr:hypothetical protein E1A91_D08G171100v1 [Gossypium mustelinum]
MSSFSLTNDSLLGILNIIKFLFSITILLVGILLSENAALTDCDRFFYKPLIWFRVFLLLVSLTGFIGACFYGHLPRMLWVYHVLMFLLIVAGIIFTIFAFAVTNKGGGRLLPGAGYKVYRLGDYSNWLQNRLNNNRDWNKIKTCLVESKVCSDLYSKYWDVSFNKFHQKPLNPIQTGCCKPPNECGFTYVNPARWVEENWQVYGENPDCKAWDNDQNILCYNCESCKAGVLDNIKHSWKKVQWFYVICQMLLIIMYAVGCFAFRNILIDES